MIVLGIDPGTRCGWAVLDGGKRVASGVWDLRPKRHEGAGMRYLRLRSYLDEALKMQLTCVGYEEVYRHLGTDAAHIYGGIVATIMQACETHEVPYRGVPVTTVKRIGCEKGNASKDMMVAAARTVFDVEVSDDEADALFVALALTKELAA